MNSWVWPVRRARASSSRRRCSARRGRPAAGSRRRRSSGRSGRWRPAPAAATPGRPAGPPAMPEVMRGPHHRRARIGHGRHARFADQADVVAVAARLPAAAAHRRRPARGRPSCAPRAAVPGSPAACSGLRQRMRSRRRASGRRASILAFSQIQCVQPRGDAQRGVRHHVGQRRLRVAAEVQRRRDQVERAGASGHPQAGGAQHAAGADQRQADQGGGVVAVDRFQQRDAQAFALGAARAVVRLLGAQVASISASPRAPEASPRTGARSCCSKPLSSAQTTATAVWKITLRPRMRRSCAVARSWLPGLPSGSPSRSATWSEPITIAVGPALRHVAGLGDGEPHGQGGRRLAGRGVSSTSGATTSNGSPRRSSSSRR